MIFCFAFGLFSFLQMNVHLKFLVILSIEKQLLMINVYIYFCFRFA